MDSVIPSKAEIHPLSWPMYHWVSIEQRIPIQRSAVAGIPPEQMQRFRTE